MQQTIIIPSNNEVRKFGAGGAAAGIMRRRPTTAAFSPPQIANLQLWVTATASGSIQSSGTTVTAWIDQSPNAFTSTPINTPQYSSGGGPNGYDCVVVNGDKYISYGANNQAEFATNNPFTVFGVVKMDTFTTDRAFFAKHDSFSNGFAMGHGYPDTTTITFWSGYWSQQSNGFAPGTGVWFYTCGRWNGTNLSIWNKSTKLTDVGLASSANNTSTKIKVGGNASPYGWIGSIAECVFYNTGLSDTDVGTWLTHFASVYAL